MIRAVLRQTTRRALVPVVALATTLAGALMSACGSSTSATAEGPRPAPLDRSAALLGPLAANGVRIDIEAHIVKTYTSAPQQAAARQMARALQESLVVNLSDSTAITNVDRQIGHAHDCVFSKFSISEATDASRQLEALIGNTKTRLAAYLAFNDALDGSSWKSTENNPCE